mmetsp:Transcript_10720/g.12431  ORF Transcript_10720/g.12431 Transcript_10720/m.12431 type:complete len:283 (+) Transcript_10720:101-949(+)
MINIYRHKSNSSKRRTMKQNIFLSLTTLLAVSLVAYFVINNHNMKQLSTEYDQRFATKSSLQNNGNGCLVSFGEYHGHNYKTDSTIGEGKCLVQSKWMQVMQHKVKLDDNTIIDDWLFIDYHDRINVLVEDPSYPKQQQGTEKEKRYLVIRQSKYALEGRQSLAIVGGIIEPGEDPSTAAIREVSEELGFVCSVKFLGRFRTDVNRGMGWVNSFVAQNCIKKELIENGQNLDPNEEVGAPDTERQDVISMSLSEIHQNSQKGEFLEVQWSNTVALALLDELL